jgi:3-oxoacyl-[acyl-carrier protein] reductase
MNHTVYVGQRETIEMAVSTQLIDSFAALSGDDNPLHMDDVAAKRYGFPQRVSHGVLSMAFVSTLIGKKLPGAGALWRSLKVNWLRPVYPDDIIEIAGVVTQISSSTSSLAMTVEGTNQHGTVVFQGEVHIGFGQEIISTESASAEVKQVVKPLPESSLPAILVTGGSRGIGRAIALDLGRAGYPVAIAYHQAHSEAFRVVAEIEAGGGQAVVLRMDLGMAIDNNELCRAEVKLGPLLGLIHAASPPLQSRPFELLNRQDFQSYFNLYVCSAVELIQAMYGNMKQHHFGRVVILGTSAIIGSPPTKMAAYVTGKSAALGLCKGLAMELGPLGVTVNMISPGLTITDLTRDYSPRMQLAEAQRTAMRRLATPSDAASLVRFLLSEEASFITGANLPLTGGSVLP